MSHWNYRLCVEAEDDGEDGTQPVYSIREVYYDDDGAVQGWTAQPATFVGDTPGEVIEALHRALMAWPTKGVLDLDTRETVKVTYHGKRKP